MSIGVTTGGREGISASSYAHDCGGRDVDLRAKATSWDVIPNDSTGVSDQSMLERVA